jgi:hypothetical protein
MDISLFGEKILLPLLIGGAGGFFTHFYLASKLKKKELAVKVIEQFLAKDKERSEARGILSNPQYVNNPVHRNSVQALGNWFEAIAILCVEGQVEERLIRKVGIDTEAIALRDDIKSAAQQSILCDEARKDLKEMANAWPHLDWFLRRR